MEETAMTPSELRAHRQRGLALIATHMAQSEPHGHYTFADSEPIRRERHDALTFLLYTIAFFAVPPGFVFLFALALKALRSL